ncbi:MAG: chemotaxis protein CheX [Planctomycetota bacterium]
MNHIDAAQIAEAVQAVWGTTLGLEVGPSSDGPPQESTLIGSVGISGRWKGALTMELPAGLARQAAAAMFMMSEEETSSDELQDALGELVNQVAGIVRPLISEQCVLSLPTVATGQDGGLAILGAQTLLDVPMACGPEPIRVTLLHKAED